LNKNRHCSSWTKHSSSSTL